MAGPIRISLLANGRQARSEISRTATSLGAIDRAASRAGKLLAGAFAIGALVRVGRAVGKVGSEYVDSLNKIQALTGSTDRQLQGIATRLESQSSAFARYGQTTGDAAQGMVELTKSGLSAQKALGAIRGTMLLAKASELQVADASELVANTLNTFGLKASKAADIANSLANAANISSSDVSDLAESFKYVAPLSAKAGVSIDQTNAFLAELANSGIKASQAGTSLRTFLLNLQAPSAAGSKALEALNVQVYDAQGNMRPLPDLIGQLNKGLGGLSQAGQNAKLKDVFGKIGITGASVILKNGTDGLAEYTKGIQRAGAAEALAASASKGLAGTLSSVKAQVVSTTQELYRKYSPALDDALQGAIAFAGEHKDDVVSALSAVGNVLTDHVGPALEAVTRLVGDTAQAFGGNGDGLAHQVGNLALDALSTFSDVVRTTADLLDQIPAPIKAIGVQAGIAALVLPRLSAGVTSVTASVTTNIARLQQWRAEMTYSATRAQNTAAMMQRLGAAAKAAAGIGGMVALTRSTSETNDTLKTFEQVGGGAALGFSVGGPWGAALGAGAGGFLAIRDAVKAANGGFLNYDAALDAARDKQTAAISSADSLRETLDQVTGAATRATRAFILQKLTEDGIIGAASVVGIKTRDLIDATLGHADAIKRVNAAARNNADVLRGLENTKLRQWIYDQNKALTAQQSALRATNDDLETWKQSLKGVPKNVRTELKAMGYKATRDQVRDLVKSYDPKKYPRLVQTIMKAIGTGKVVGDATKAKGALEGVSKARVRLEPWLLALTGGVRKGEQETESGGKQIQGNLENPVAGTKADLTAFYASLGSGISRARGAASSGGLGIGNALGSGVNQGASSWVGNVIGTMTSMVNQAVAAARRAADAHSPSRKMAALGRDLADGVVLGMKQREVKGSKAAQRFVRKMLRGATDGLDGMRKVIDRLTSLIEKKLDGKKQTARRKALLKSLKDEEKALIRNGRAQERNSRKLDNAIQKYKDLKRQANEFARSIKQGFVDYGNVVGLGTIGGGATVTADRIISQLQARAEVAAKVQALIKQLSKGGLNQTSLQQILDAVASGDLEGALATASAIAAGGSGAIAQINALMAQIAASGGNLGDKMRDKFFGAGLQAAEGLIKGLEKRQKELDQIAERLATALVRKVKKALGIHSPSSVFRDIGDQTIAGLAGSLRGNETYVKRLGSKTAGALVGGFGTPALDAYMSTAASGTGGGQTITVRLTAEQLSSIQRGKAVQLDLDAYYRAGGRRSAVGPR